jgi:hypothetical protein
MDRRCRCRTDTLDLFKRTSAVTAEFCARRDLFSAIPAGPESGRGSLVCTRELIAAVPAEFRVYVQLFSAPAAVFDTFSHIVFSSTRSIISTLGPDTQKTPVRNA